MEPTRIVIPIPELNFWSSLTRKEKIRVLVMFVIATIIYLCIIYYPVKCAIGYCGHPGYYIIKNASINGRIDGRLLIHHFLAMMNKTTTLDKNHSMY